MERPTLNLMVTSVTAAQGRAEERVHLQAVYLSSTNIIKHFFRRISVMDKAEERKHGKLKDKLWSGR